MARIYRYRAATSCQATVRETWTITVSRRLSRNEIANVLTGGTSDGVEIDCVDERVDDEHDRAVLGIYPLEGE